MSDWSGDTVSLNRSSKRALKLTSRYLAAAVGGGGRRCRGSGHACVALPPVHDGASLPSRGSLAGTTCAPPMTRATGRRDGGRYGSVIPCS